jgi:hypothetical protein
MSESLLPTYLETSEVRRQIEARVLPPVPGFDPPSADSKPKPEPKPAPRPTKKRRL